MTPLRTTLALLLLVVCMLLAAGCVGQTHSPAVQANSTTFPTTIPIFLPEVITNTAVSPAVSQISTNTSSVDPIIGAWRYTTISGDKGGVERNIHFYCETYVETYTYCEHEAGPCRSPTPVQGTWKAQGNGTYILSNNQRWEYSSANDVIFENDPEMYSRNSAPYNSTVLQASPDASPPDPITGDWEHGNTFMYFYPNEKYLETSQYCDSGSHTCRGFAPIQGAWKALGNGTYIVSHDGITKHWEYSSAQDMIFEVDYLYFSRHYGLG